MGAIINAIVIVIAGGIGLLFKKGIPVKIHERVMEGIGLAVIAISIPGILKGENTIVMILSIVIGILMGELIDIDSKVTELAMKIERRLTKNKQQSSNNINWINAFVSATLITCVGSMSVVGSLESGLTGNNTTLYSKSIIDAITSFLLATSMGPGVMLASVSILIFEGVIILFAKSMSVYMPAEVVAEISCVGSIILLGLGLNILKITELKVLNFTPAILMPIILMIFL